MFFDFLSREIYPRYRHLKKKISCKELERLIIKGDSVVKKLPSNAGDIRTPRFDPWVGKIPWRRAWQCTPVFLLGESHGQRSLGSQRVKHD